MRKILLAGGSLPKIFCGDSVSEKKKLGERGQSSHGKDMKPVIFGYSFFFLLLQFHTKTISNLIGSNSRVKEKKNVVNDCRTGKPMRCFPEDRDTAVASNAVHEQFVMIRFWGCSEYFGGPVSNL